ncbi:MAG: ABC transporter permease [Anaerolineales bacterium]|nr:ABC transporter permease [Anaerolineales bacterium]
MRHIIRLTWNEFLLARSEMAVLLIAVFQPTLMFFLMSLVLVQPTFDVQVLPSGMAADEDLLRAMNTVGIQSGVPYINPILLEEPSFGLGSQYLHIENESGNPEVVQYFNLIDSNMVKNFRNRLTAAGLILWNEELGSRAVEIREVPLLPIDVPYTVYFGLGMVPLAAFLATIMVGASTTTHDYETDTILEYQLSPLAPAWILAARIMRTVLIGWFASTVLFLMLWLLSGYAPRFGILAAVILFPICLIGSSLGVSIGLAIRRPLPAFVISLASSFLFWLMGGAFGLPSGFNQGYELVSRFIPNTHAVELLFPMMYEINVGSPVLSVIILVLQSGLSLLLVYRLYRNRVASSQEPNHA